MTRTAAPAPSRAASSTAAAPPRAATAATCRSEAPRARIKANSPRRCSVTSLAPISTTTAPMTARLTNISESARCTAASVATKDAGARSPGRN